MAEEKKYYWIKLRTDFFNQDTIDFLITQNNGCEYIVLYQMLCLQTANSDGRLCKMIGEIIVPYNVEKIVRDTKYFDAETVFNALELFKKLGLIYEDKDGILVISGYDAMIGYETSTSKRVKQWRNNKASQCNKNVTPNVTLDVTDDVTVNVTPDVTQEIEIRDKSIENIDKDKELEIEESEKRKRFFPPTLVEVSDYCLERGNNINAQRFIDYYEANGWHVGKSKMKDWKAAVRNWEKNENNFSSSGTNGRSDRVVIDMPDYIKQQREGTLPEQPKASADKLAMVQEMQRKIREGEL